MTGELTRHGASIESSEGWLVRLVDPELIEYRFGSTTCLVNVGYSHAERAREIFASESRSEWFPNLCEHIQSAVQLFEGRYIVV
ncbi:MAG: hypothetical protein JWP52_3942 [Rhizobacter sp.]|nr:hypothetical protein [Rhizobacter sp.]